ncbi:hypothetical protein B0I35DRAFT_352965, partial [Stachybotrys elegans]
SPLSISPPSQFPPLRTASVQPDTVIAHPTPIIQSTSDITLALKHPTPDLNTRSGSCLSNIAQLEATAERLSMTSSIDDAIRELHGELKRSDSRRSSQLAAYTASLADDAAPTTAVQLTRHRSHSSSIVATNTAARQGGYSPAAYVMSPNHSLTGRLRAGSKTSTGRPDIDLEPTITRHGPGKTSVRSVRSAKMSLAEISESEPISLTQTVLDEADAAPPLRLEDHPAATSADKPYQLELPGTGLSSWNLDDHDKTPLALDPAAETTKQGASHAAEQRPRSSHSENYSDQDEDAFKDFDGVHCEPDDDYYEPPHPQPHPHAPRVPPPDMARPQSYFDPASGQQMLYYPARVPAMLNLPPKLSSRPKAAERNMRHSQVLGAMMEANGFVPRPAANRSSAMPDRKSNAGLAAGRDSWLPDPIAGHRDSFAALSSYDPLRDPDAQSTRGDEPAMQPEHEIEPEQPSDTLRRPPRLSQMDPENRKSRMSKLDALPAHLRASAYFDLPSTSPEIEIKDGSAMATLDSILDASAHAPVSAFVDHTFAGKLGAEVYGKEKKRKSQGAAAALAPDAAMPGHKKKPSFMGLGKRSTSYNSADKSATTSDPRHGEDSDGEGQAQRRSIDGRSDDDQDNDAHAAEGEGQSDEDSDEVPDTYQGAPTTLLAELQIRKQQQKQRTQHITKAFPNGMHSTLLEMDAVAETQRKHRKNKRVNLAWEDPDGMHNQEESDDEDVPLAIIAAKAHGAKNLADLERPIGLMERREMEENEPLSHRRARLQGLEPPMVAKRPSMMAFSASMPMLAGGAPLSPGSPLIQEPPEEEIEGETLGERRRRLAAKEAAQDEADGRLSRVRPVSNAFSAELLSQFGDTLEPEKPSSRKENKTPNVNGEEETLGQRRRRLQAEREAREQEMNHQTPTAAGQEDKLTRRLSLADMLSAHPKKVEDPHSLEEKRRVEEQNRIAREQEAKLAAMRKQMPTTLITPTVERSGGFRGGRYNDGIGGGQGLLHTAQSNPALHTQAYGMNQLNHRASTVFSAYNMPTQQPMYGGGMNMGALQQGAQYPMPGSMNRVEQWRQGVSQ